MPMSSLNAESQTKLSDNDNYNMEIETILYLIPRGP